MSSLPKKTDDGKGLVSYSQMRLFKMCPKAYEFRYIEGLRLPLSGKVKVGSAFDKAADVLLRSRMQNEDVVAEAGITAALDYMKDPGEEFDETDIASDDELDARLTGAIEEYAALAEKIDVVRVQHELDYPLNDDVILTGKIDVVESVPDGGLVITDNKTTLKKRSGKYTYDLATTDEQLTLYSATLELGEPDASNVIGRGWRVVDIGRKTPGRIENIHVKDNDPDATAKLAIDNALITLDMMEHACDTGLFAPLGRGSWKCSHTYCEFFNRCDYGSQSHTTIPMGEF